MSVRGLEVSSQHFGVKQVRKVAAQDQWDGGENLAAFFHCLDGELARRDSRTTGLALLAIEVEQATPTGAYWLRHALRPGDIVMKVGTESFAMICRDVGGWPELSLLVEHLRDHFHQSRHSFDDGNQALISVSAIFADDVSHGQDSACDLARRVGLWNGLQDVQRSTQAPIKGTS